MQSDSRQPSQDQTGHHIPGAGHRVGSVPLPTLPEACRPWPTAKGCRHSRHSLSRQPRTRIRNTSARRPCHTRPSASSTLWNEWEDIKDDILVARLKQAMLHLSEESMLRKDFVTYLMESIKDSGARNQPGALFALLGGGGGRVCFLLSGRGCVYVFFFFFFFFFLFGRGAGLGA